MEWQAISFAGVLLFYLSHRKFLFFFKNKLNIMPLSFPASRGNYFFLYALPVLYVPLKGLILLD